jgi:hypothetical protein
MPKREEQEHNAYGNQERYVEEFERMQEGQGRMQDLLAEEAEGKQVAPEKEGAQIPEELENVAGRNIEALRVIVSQRQIVK